jgi:hypothetical protein
MRSAELLKIKPLNEKYFETVDYESDGFDDCTSCGNEDILYILDAENKVCYECWNKIDQGLEECK